MKVEVRFWNRWIKPRFERCADGTAVAYFGVGRLSWQRRWRPPVDMYAGAPEPGMPCADGTPVHDFQGQPSCPACGFVGLSLSASSPVQDEPRPDPSPPQEVETK